MDHVRALVALTHDRKAADFIQFTHLLTIYTELRYKLEILRYYHSNAYLPNSLTGTAPFSLDALIARNNDISVDSDEYARNEVEIERIRTQKNAEIDMLTRDFDDSIERIIQSDYIRRYKYSLVYLDMLRRQLKNHLP